MILGLQRQWTRLSMGARVIIGMIALLVGTILLIELVIPAVASGVSALTEFGWLRILAILIGVVGLGVRTFSPATLPFVFGIPSAIAALYLVVSLFPGWESWPTYYPATFWGTIIALLSAGITLSYAITWESSTGRKILRALHIAMAVTFIGGVLGGFISSQSRYEWTVAALRKEAAKKRVEPVEEQLKKCRAQIQQATTPAEADLILNGCEEIARQAEGIHTQYGFGPPASPLKAVKGLFAKEPPKPAFLIARTLVFQDLPEMRIELICNEAGKRKHDGFTLEPNQEARITLSGSYQRGWEHLSGAEILAASTAFLRDVASGKTAHLEQIEVTAPEEVMKFRPDDPTHTINVQNARKTPVSVAVRSRCETGWLETDKIELRVVFGPLNAPLS